MRRGTSENSWSRSTSWHWRSAAGKTKKQKIPSSRRRQTKNGRENRTKQMRNHESEGLAASSWTGRVRMSRMRRCLTLGGGQDGNDETTPTNSANGTHGTKGKRNFPSPFHPLFFLCLCDCCAGPVPSYAPLDDGPGRRRP